MEQFYVRGQQTTEHPGDAKSLKEIFRLRMEAFSLTKDKSSSGRLAVC
jgi:hypothetical protein